MKRNLKPERGMRKPQGGDIRGVALIIVLGLLVIILGLAVTFLNRITIERGASASYAADAATRQYADSAVNLVQGQIHRASTLGTNVAWASQPGMIRTFGKGAGPYIASTNALLNFKLYSAPDMVTAATTFADDVPPATWADEKALWTDLNAPVRGIFPILAPQPVSGGAEEFSITSAPGATTVQPAPMPVRWLYLLQGGEIVAPGGSGNALTVAGAGTGNPIVGRIAFWTDDETCKVNINTASDGTFWDVPRASSDEEKAFAKFQPAQKEFQRYPGHPAMTSLKAVFPSLTSNQIYNLIPRVVGGGSEGGTVQVSTASAPLTPDSDRLYASVDELMFQAGGNRAANAGLTKPQLDEARFFLTANSRAPEVTLFNTPRVAIWPIDATPANRTVFDRLIAFCSTINGQPYYFQRQNPKSATVDASIPRNVSLYGYLQKLTNVPFPGFGPPSFSTKFGADRDQILTEIFDYIRSTNLDDSGLAGSNGFAGRAMLFPAFPANPLWRSPGFGQVIPSRIGSTQGFGRFPTISEAGIHFICTADGGNGTAGGVLGSNVATNRTLGSPATLLTANQRRIEALFFLETFIPGQGWPPITPAYSVRIRGLNQFQITGGLPTPSLGFPADAHDLSRYDSAVFYHGRGWGGSVSHRLALTGARLPARGSMPADALAALPDLDRYPFVSIPITVDSTAGTMTFVGGNLTVDVYQRTSNSGVGYSPSDVPVNTYTIEIPGGTFPIPSLVGSGTLASGSSTPATTKENWWTFSRDGCGLATNGRIFFSGNNPGNSAGPFAGALFRAEDVVRTVVPAHSDFRLLSAKQSVLSSAFVPHPSYGNQAINLAHSVVETTLSNLFVGVGFDTNRLAPGVAYWGGSIPDVAIYHANAAFGDWDNGLTTTLDGPYINKPDEGNSYALASGDIPYFTSGSSYANSSQAMFSPNRQVPSAGMFGSLSSGVVAGVPYRTLLFRPQAGYFGETNPRDHLWTDLFWMPIVEPYAISEPFSTAGKINMNYQIVPFDYLRRATGMAALLRSEKIMAISNASGSNYKTDAGAGSKKFRLAIDIPLTLSQFDAVFNSGTLFKSASQIMEMPLVPVGQTVAGMSIFWDNHKLTGDNSRERPYTNLLGRLTTKSNTYTVHYRVQALKKSSATPAGQWDESRDKVTGEYRGSTTVERYINPNDSAIPPYGSSADPLAEPGLGMFYKWRVVNTRKFEP
jgi:hypothetical protein